MQTLQYTIQINAPKQQVWFSLWDDLHYQKWTSVFCEGSYYAGALEEGAEIRFLTPNGSGMHSLVEKVVENQTMHFCHQGDIVAGEKVAVNWQNAREQYQISEENGICTVQVTHDVLPEYVDYMNEKFPQALQVLKELAEDFYIVLETEIHAPIQTIWDAYTQPQHIQQWNYASTDWHCPKATNDFKVGGKFCYTMAAKDESMSFDFTGKFTDIEVPHTLKSHLDDNREVVFLLCENEGITHVLQRFQPESENSFELQKTGWSMILANFKAYCEGF